MQQLITIARACTAAPRKNLIRKQDAILTDPSMIHVKRKKTPL